MEVNGNQNHLVTNILQNILFYILKNVGNQIISAPNVFHCINQKKKKKKSKSMWTETVWLPTFLQKKVSHTGLQRHEGK